MNGIGYIYKITNKQDGKIYVGKSKTTVQSRWHGHLRDYKKYIQQDKNTSKLYNAIRKYGIDSFEIEQIDQCSYRDLDEKERYWISKLNSRDPSVGYNICKGGECGPGGPRFAGHKHSEETKAQMSLSRRGENNSNYNHHRVMPEEEKQKHAHPGESNGMWGKKHSEETKELNRQAQIGRIWMTDRQSNVHIHPKDAWFYEKAGYHRGMTKNKKDLTIE